ncbi:MAG: glutamate formimidoyltransferase [Planctomycetota bacterium]|jgi:glutamate formiminotransferase/formiminotetrahydrofolate cyclodeaminase|nr:glutamate formimidoyltransferase [Planctomycetota bacterium]
MDRLIECVPNFSEGRDMDVIKRITDAIEAVDGVSLLDVDPGAATNRTVVTFVGSPEAVINAAVVAGKLSAELIDMSKHRGEHPRFGAMDVCPLVPIAGVTMEETAEYARELARRLGEEAGLTIYCYENAALKPDRQNLANVRRGEYEALKDRLQDPQWAPDFGPTQFQPGTGATAVSARDFLVAYNVNLNTTSSRRANAIAFDVREKGRIRREPCILTGEVVRDADGKPEWIPGSLKSVKGIGWFIEEFGICQVSMNLTNVSVTPTHVAFDEVSEKARLRGIRVTGSELVGLIPLSAMLDAGRYFLRKQQRSTGVSDAELIKIAVKSMGLDELYPFKPEEKIIEYVLAAQSDRKLLVDLSLKGFVEETASESPAPGGGSVAAALGALGSALGTMVANLSSHKRGWDSKWEEYSDWAERGKACHRELLALIDRDTDAFNAIMATWKMPSKTAEQKAAKEAATQAAVHQAIAIPFRIMEVALESMEVTSTMVDKGIQASISDSGVAALCARSAVMGAYLNVRVNSGDLSDEVVRQDFLDRGAKLQEQAIELEREILQRVNKAFE